MAIGARKSEKLINLLCWLGLESAMFVADHYDFTLYARKVHKRLKKAANRRKQAAKTETI